MTELHTTWSADDGQCIAMGCSCLRGLADPYCENHRAIIDAGGQLPVCKPPDARLLRDGTWTLPAHR